MAGGGGGWLGEDPGEDPGEEEGHEMLRSRCGEVAHVDEQPPF